MDSREAFLEKLRSFEIKGAGGTSFTPVFSYLNEQLKSGTLSDLQGLIYFTDGYGSFPEKDPGIRTAMVLYETDCRPEALPSWAEIVQIQNKEEKP